MSREIDGEHRLERYRARLLAQRDAEREILPDSGFAYTEAAHRSAYFARLRKEVSSVAEEGRALRASIVRRQAEILIELVDQRIRSQRIVHQALGARLGRNLLGFINHCLGKVGKAPIHGPHEGELEGVRHLEVAMELAQAVFEHPEAVFAAHRNGSSNPVVAASDANSAAGFPHRLSGDQI